MNPSENIDYSRKHDLTIEEIKSCKIFSHFNDSQAQEVIDTIKQLTEIAYDAYIASKKEQKSS